MKSDISKIKTPESINKKNIVLFIVAHTDDETLGIGGTIAKHHIDKDAVFGISMTDGIGSRNIKSQEEKQKRLCNAVKAAEILGFEWIKHGNFPDNKMDTVPLLEIVKFIESVKKINPNIIYTHSPSDLNIDHRKVFEATLTAFRPQPNEKWNEIRSFEVPSATDYGSNNFSNNFNPNLYVNISNTISKKLEAFKQYKKEIRAYPHSRSLEGVKTLAKYRGLSVGLEYAEAFQIVKKIDR